METKQIIYEAITNKVLWISISAWGVAQLIKVFLGLLREKRIDLGYFVASGRMPSAHSATVSALATSVAIEQGMGSAVFAISVIVALITMYDAAGVRRSVSRQSVTLNRLVRELFEKDHRGAFEHDLREFIGHTPFQVIIGAALGIFVAWLGFFIFG